MKDWLEFIADIESRAGEIIDRHRGSLTDKGATHAEHVAGKGDPKRAAISALLICGEIREQARTLADKPDQLGGIMAALAWRLHMTASWIYTDELRPAFLSVEQANRGKRGAATRWSHKEALGPLMDHLARKKDELGDPLRPNELWPELFNLLDGAQLDPKESGDEYLYVGGKISYEAFRKGIQRRR